LSNCDKHGVGVSRSLPLPTIDEAGIHTAQQKLVSLVHKKSMQ